MAERKTKNGLTQEEYIQIKTFLSVPLPISEIESRTQRSWPTIRNVRDSIDFEDYHALGRKQSKEKTALQEKIEAKKTEVEQPTEALAMTTEGAQMVFGERQTPEENTVEKVEEPKQEVNKFEELMSLERELLSVNKQILETEKELAGKIQNLMETLGVNTEAIKDLATAIRE